MAKCKGKRKSSPPTSPPPPAPLKRSRSYNIDTRQRRKKRLQWQMELLVDDVLVTIAQLALRIPTEVLRFAVVCRRWARLVKEGPRTLSFMTWHIPRISCASSHAVFDHHKLVLAPKSLCRIWLGPKTNLPGLKAICKVFRRLMSLTVTCSDLQWADNNQRSRNIRIPALEDAFRSYPLYDLKHLRIIQNATQSVCVASIQNARRGLPHPWCFSYLPYWVPSLEHLDLSGCEVLTDECMAGVFESPCLRRLNLAGCFGLTDLSLVALSSCTTLQHLSLCDTNVSKKGILDMLNMLKPLDLVLDLEQSQECFPYLWHS